MLLPDPNRNRRRRDDHLGVGWRFPARINPATGGWEMTSDGPHHETSPEGQRLHIEGALRMLWGTRLGERAMRADYGTRIDDIPFEPNDRLGVVPLIRFFAVDAVEKWEQRINVTSSYVEAEVVAGEGRAYLSARYKIRGINEEGNVVVPFSTRGQ